MIPDFFDKGRQKQLITLRIDKALLDDLKKAALRSGCQSLTIYIEWVFRSALYPPEKALRILARQLAQELAVIQDRIRDLEDQRKKEEEIAEIA